MTYFIPAYFQKRILRYALSKLDFLDAEQLNLDKLDIAWGKRSVIELRDLGVQLKVQEIRCWWLSNVNLALLNRSSPLS